MARPKPEHRRRASEPVRVHPKTIHQWNRALPKGASGVFERCGSKMPEIDEERVKVLHAEIRETAVLNLVSKIKPQLWDGK